MLTHCSLKICRLAQNHHTTVDWRDRLSGNLENLEMSDDLTLTAPVKCQEIDQKSRKCSESVRVKILSEKLFIANFMPVFITMTSA